jgi:endonuclease/exonuclease/phosphatase family metal-dependent hydrolase
LAASLQATLQAVKQQMQACQGRGLAVQNTLIMGDFNVDFKQGTMDEKRSCMQQLMQDHSFTLVSPSTQPTHDNGSHIDTVWFRSSAADAANVDSGITPTYWSDHSAVWVQLSPPTDDMDES